MLKFLLTTLLTLLCPVCAMDAPVHVTFRGERLLIVTSWYCAGFRGRITASGQKYDCRGYTAAHRHYPFGTVLLLRNPANNRETLATVNDRGPYFHGRGLDVSEKVAELLGFKEKGVVLIEMTPIYFGRER